MNYELSRMRRYENVLERVEYTHTDLVRAYLNWVNLSPYQDRNHAWNIYCDVRDGMPVGTNSRLPEIDYIANKKKFAEWNKR